MIKKKDLKYYLSLNYDVIIKKYVDEEEVFYQALTRELNPDAFYGVGKTIQEAVDSLEETKKIMFQVQLDDGTSIMEPIRFEPDITHIIKKSSQNLPIIYFIDDGRRLECSVEKSFSGLFCLKVGRDMAHFTYSSIYQLIYDLEKIMRICYEDKEI